MTQPYKGNPASLSLSLAERIDALCVRFEQSWQAGETPKVEQYLEGVPDGEREPLLRELLRLEAHYRAQRGERSTAEMDTGHFPGESAAEPITTLPPSDRKGELSFLEPPRAADELGRLGRFRILEVLGIGGMGIVFRADDTGLRRQIALKVMRPEYSSRAEARERFLHEARAMAKVKDDHVITVYDVGTLGPVAFVAMELLRGQGLHHRLEKDRRLAWPEVVPVGVETARGLAAAHAGGLIHRDIKPSNLWLEELPAAGANERRERVKVLDFGLAREVDCDNSLSPEGTVLGTPAYMAPEQARGDRVDERADLFSLGCVLYELVTGHRPFTGRDAFQILVQVANHHPPPALQLTPEMPASLSRLIEELLAKDRDQRLASARDVIDRLQAIAAGQTGPRSAVTPSVAPTHPPGPATLTSPPGRSAGKRGWLVAGGLGAAALVGLAGWGLAPFWFRQPADPGDRQAVVKEEALRGELIVRIRSKDGRKRGARIGDDPLALPVREDDLLQLEAKLNQPAYVYLLWVDGKGEVTPLYPWNPDGKLVHRTLAVPPPAQTPQAEVRNPDHRSAWWPADDTEGLDTMLLLARKMPLPADVSLAGLVGTPPRAKLGPLHEVVVRGMDRGRRVEEVNRDLDRRPKGDVEVVEDQLLSLMDRLQGHFELIRAVQFAHASR